MDGTRARKIADRFTGNMNFIVRSYCDGLQVCIITIPIINGADAVSSQLQCTQVLRVNGVTFCGMEGGTIFISTPAIV